MKTKTTEVTEGDVSKFQSLIYAGIQAWTDAGILLCSMVDADPGVFDRITEKCPEITRAHLAKFEAIGRGALDPRLLLNGSIGYTKLQKAPLSEQKKALTEGIKVAELKDGKTDHRIVKPDQLNPMEASQVFAPTGAIRSLSEQQSYLAKREVRRRAEESQRLADHAEYIIRGRKVIFKNDCCIGAGELAKILSEITK